MIRDGFRTMTLGTVNASSEPVVAVTGTNGKTSVAVFLRQIWEADGHRAVSIGSEGLSRRGARSPFERLRPTAAPFARYLQDHVDPSRERVVFEAHSDGLEELVYHGVALRAAAFTNLSRDHLDYHGSLSVYFRAKRRLFHEVLEEGVSVINVDDHYGAKLAHEIRTQGRPLVAVGRGGDVSWEGPTPGVHGHWRLVAGGDAVDVCAPLAGGLQRDNLLCAVGLALACGTPLARLATSLERLRPPAGRLELVAAQGGRRIYVDFAHNPGGLAAVLTALRKMSTGRLIAIIGCGGERDTGKRSQMGAVARQHADEVIVTDDNPRRELPSSIRAAVRQGCPDATEVPDRRDAIRLAVDRLGEGDTLLVSGRGAESHQEIAGRRVPLDDRKTVRVAVRDAARAGRQPAWQLYGALGPSCNR